MNELFIIGLTGIIGVLLAWGFQSLPHEKWQIMAAIPKKKNGNDEWIGENLTFYGVFMANSIAVSVAILVLLLGAVSMPYIAIIIVSTLIIGICLPAGKIIARIVEKKQNTRTIGGASFTGILVAPAGIGLINITLGKWIGFHVDVFVFLSAISVAYAFGEGLGRLACISFGCCYGKPVSKCSPRIQRLFQKMNFVFSGKTKKIAYADHLDGEKVIPIQAITSIIYCLSGIVGAYLFLKGYYLIAFIMTLAVTQIWRFLSEFIRADYRGGGKISAYQIMGGLSIVYAIVLMMILPIPASKNADIMMGMNYLWRPEMIIFLQGLWLYAFLSTGRSKVTGASLSFHVNRECI